MNTKQNIMLKNKETGQIESIESIHRGYMELLSNSDEFNEYVADFDKFLINYYEVSDD